jgi:Subtilase family
MTPGPFYGCKARLRMSDGKTKPAGTGRPTRRQMLRRLGLAATAAYVAPALLHLAPARASSVSFSSSVVRRRKSAKRPRRPPPEFVLAVPTPADLARVAAAGYEILASERVDLMQLELARVRSRTARTLTQARSHIAGIVPGALFDLNHLYRPNALTCEAGGCAAFNLIGWPARRAGCGLSPAIGMIDTAVNGTHPALRGSRLDIVRGASSGRRRSSAAHGTAIAALLVGRADSAAPGLLPQARLVAVDAFHADGRGDAADAFDLVRAIGFLVGRNVGVINMSFSGAANDVLERAVLAAAGRGVALVAAAGNDGPRARPLYPAAYDRVVAVTAVDRQSRIYPRASRGRHISFAAPGVRLWTVAAAGGGRLRSGTSYAAPFVTAAIAAARAAAPDRPLDAILAQLAENAVDLGPSGRDDTFGWGLVRVHIECGGAG